jgi:hypothetical protein
VAQKDKMIIFHEMEHAQLLEEDLLPNNIHWKKVYHQMTLHIQEGQVHRRGWSGTCYPHALRMVHACCSPHQRLSFPSPTFMGF